MSAGAVDGPPTRPLPAPVMLDEAECLRLLGTATVGRLSFTDGALPAVVPVPFALIGGQVLIPVHEGSAVMGGVRGAVVAFEVDSFDAVTETGWSVTVVGPSRVLGAPARLAGFSLAGLPEHWTGPGRRLVAVQVGRLRGWRACDPGHRSLYHHPEASAG